MRRIFYTSAYLFNILSVKLAYIQSESLTNCNKHVDRVYEGDFKILKK